MAGKEHRVERRLAAIFAADVAGYSHLMEQDEVGTLRTLTAHRHTMDSLIAQHRGRIANTAGDSVLAEFPSVVDAVQCALEIQETLQRANNALPPERCLAFRIGVHVGDVMVAGNDLLGDAVNIAARLQALAHPGGICISDAAQQYVRKALPLRVEDLGPQIVKNIEERIKAFSVKSVEEVEVPVQGQSRPLTLPDKPSLAVLPFANLSGDPEQEYFADGLVEDIVTALSQVRWFFVIARNSSFSFRDRAMDLKQIGRELGVRYVVEGSVRRAGDRIRLTSQLIEAATGTHLWADRFDGSLADIFDFQDRITEGVVAAIEPSLRHAEIERARRKRPNSLDAYDLYLRAMPLAYANTTESSNEALRLLAEALKIDPNYAAAQAHTAWCYEQRYQRGGQNPEDKREAVRHARSVIASTTDDTLALAISGFVVGMLTLDYGTAVGAADRALALNGNSALALGFAAMTEANAGLHDKALEHGMRAIRLSPLDPMNYHPYLGMGFAYFFSGRGEEAVAAAQRAIQVNPTFVISHALLVASYAQLDELDAAKRAADRLLDVAPGFTVSIMEQHEFTEPVKVALFGAALRKAGLPN